MKVSIRPWLISDAAAIAAVLNNINVQNNLRDGLPYPYRVEDAEGFINAMITAEPADVFAFAILADDQVVGSIGAFRMANVHRITAEVGYYIGQEYWGRGIATEAIKLTCKHVFKHNDIARIFAEPLAGNIASCRALEKAGFALEGILRCNAIKNGKIMDMKMYSIVRA